MNINEYIRYNFVYECNLFVLPPLEVETKSTLNCSREVSRNCNENNTHAMVIQINQ